MSTTTLRAALLISSDPSISMPDEIQIAKDGKATACHASSGDSVYDSLAELCAVYCLDIEEVEKLLPVRSEKADPAGLLLAENLISLACHHARSTPGWKSSAELMINDAEALLEKADYAAARAAALRSLSYSIGILHDDYRKAKDAASFADVPQYPEGEEAECPRADQLDMSLDAMELASRGPRHADGA